MDSGHAIFRPRFFCRLAVLTAAALLACAEAVAAAEPAGSSAGQLVGHRALYRVSLASASISSGVADAAGGVLYRFADSCDGWTVENRTAIRLDLIEGGETLSDWTYTSWESKDGKLFRFRVRDEQDGEVSEELHGAASIGPDGQGGIARFTQPDEFEMDLPPETLFPTAHLLAMLNKARAGSKTVIETIFDGADLDNPYRVNAVVGPAPAESRQRMAKLSGLGDLPVWAVRLAFFPLAESASTPAFEIGIHYREDGIGDAIRQDFGDIVLKLELLSIEILPKPDC